MSRYRVVLSVLVACVLVSPAIFARQERWTGTAADIIRVRVINGRDEAVPVVVREVTLAATNEHPLKVVLDPSTKVQLDPATMVRARIEPRNWEYKMLRLPRAFQDDEAQRALNTEGNQGWELVGVVSTSASGSVLALKRMK